MNSVSPSAVGTADKIKVVLAAVLLVAGVAGFYVLAGKPTIVRVASVLVGIVAGIAIGWNSEPGQRLLGFARDSIAETRKIVWPTRKESLQTAGAVAAFVILMAIFLWISDKSLEYIMYDLILGWKK